MQARFEIVLDDLDRFTFRLLDGESEVMLNGLPSSGKIAVQNEVLQARNSVRETDRFVPHESADGGHFVVLKAKNGSVLARSRRVANRAELDLLIGQIQDVARDAPLLDHARV